MFDKQNTRNSRAQGFNFIISLYLKKLLSIKNIINIKCNVYLDEKGSSTLKLVIMKNRKCFAIRPQKNF